MELSKRITGLTGGGSDGWGILYASRALEAKGQYVANLTIGEHDIRTQDIILDAMHAAALGQSDLRLLELFGLAREHVEYSRAS